MLAVILFPLFVIALVLMFGWPLAAFVVWCESSQKKKKDREEQVLFERTVMVQAALEQRRHEQLVAAIGKSSQRPSDPPRFDLS